VTGSSSGIGRAIAEGLAEEGAGVVINGRSAESLQAVAAEIAAACGGAVVPIAADVSRREEVARLVAEAAAALGGLDILVNNVPAPIFGPFLEHSDEDWHRAVEIKLMGYIRASREAVPFLKESGGVIVNNIGAGGKTYANNHSAGGATNAALMLLTAALATELGPMGIRVVGINAGAVQTGRHEALLRSRAESQGRDPAEIMRETLAAIPTGAISTPPDVADLAVFLASDRARQINGTIVTIDGGILKTI
jgi:3-oxoacyl-[acyl-carrier protein] reductase